jgi:hypothetical protein
MSLSARQLRTIIDAVKPEDLDREVKVWLPGSTISLEFNGGKPLTRKDCFIIEGNVDPGSALMED